MAFLTGLLGGALPFLGRALSSGISSAVQAVQRGGGIGDVLKAGTLGALSGAVGQPDPVERIEPRPVSLESAKSYEPKQPKLVPHRIKVPHMLYRKKPKHKTRRY